MSKEQASTAQEEEDVEAEPNVHFTPVIELPLVKLKTLEDSEDEIFKMRAKLFRYDSVEDPPIWKERGVGDIRMLQHSDTAQVRLLMRRDHIHKICCNHYITSQMKLIPHGQSERAFMWTTFADFADEEKKEEVLAIRFRYVESAEKFRSKFNGVVADLMRDNRTKEDLNTRWSKDDANKEMQIKEEKSTKDGDREIEETVETLATLSVSDKEANLTED